MFHHCILLFHVPTVHLSCSLALCTYGPHPLKYAPPFLQKHTEAHLVVLHIAVAAAAVVAAAVAVIAVAHIRNKLSSPPWGTTMKHEPPSPHTLSLPSLCQHQGP